MMHPALLMRVYTPLKGRLYKKIDKIRIMKYCDAFAPYLYLLLCPEPDTISFKRDVCMANWCRRKKIRLA